MAADQTWEKSPLLCCHAWVSVVHLRKNIDPDRTMLGRYLLKTPEFRIGETSDIEFFLKSEYYRVNKYRDRVRCYPPVQISVPSFHSI